MFFKTRRKKAGPTTSAYPSVACSREEPRVNSQHLGKAKGRPIDDWLRKLASPVTRSVSKTPGRPRNASPAFVLPSGQRVCTRRESRPGGSRDPGLVLVLPPQPHFLRL